MKRLVRHIILILLLAAPLPPTLAQQKARKTAEPVAGERIGQLLERCGVDTKHQKLFIALNWRILTKDDGLMMGYKYALPTPDDIADTDNIIKRATEARQAAAKPQSQPETAAQPAPKTTAKPQTAAPPPKQEATAKPKPRKPKEITEPLFGKKNEVVEIADSKLEGATYYLVSGHGGPDPGALSTYGGQTVSEDEYAYDVILRLARQLMRHRANVHIIIQDPDDGIRDDAALPCDDHETCMGAPIPLDQIQRLRQRSDSINSLYAKERDGYCRSVFIHVDSRSKDKRIDIFFYHYMKSPRGERLAKTLQAKMAEKYAKHQPNRGFSGEVKERDLFVLRETNPAGVFIEIANIQNKMDMVRLVKPSNREAMARWIAEALIEDYAKR